MQIGFTFAVFDAINGLKMIDEKRKLIFVENPKTATFSMKKALMGERHFYNTLDPRIATTNHDTPAVIKSKYPEKWKHYFSFVVVRNTWDRAHSFFRFYRDVAGAKSYQSISFDGWVKAGCPPPGEAHLNGPMHGEGRFDDVLCQLRYAHEVDEVIILHSFNSKERNAELQAGMNKVCARIEVPSMIISVDGNNYGRTDQSIAWKESTVIRLREMYSKEIERFGFKPPRA